MLHCPRSVVLFDLFKWFSHYAADDKPFCGHVERTSEPEPNMDITYNHSSSFNFGWNNLIKMSAPGAQR